MTLSKRFSCWRLTAALLLTPLPILYFSQEYKILAYVLSNFLFWISLFGKPHHFVTGYRLSFTAFLGCLLILLWWDSSRVSYFRPIPIAPFVWGAASGMVLGYYWVEEYYGKINRDGENPLAGKSEETSHNFASLAVKYLAIFVFFLFIAYLLWPARPM